MAIPCIWILLASLVKRLHDLGINGWFVCLSIIPMVYAFFLIYAAFFKGQECDNKYGPNPY